MAPQKKIKFSVEDIKGKVDRKNTSYYEKARISPSDPETNPSEKDTKQYIKPWVEYFYSLFQKKATWMGADYDHIDTMRSFMEGTQDVNQYRDFIYGVAKNEKGMAFDSSGNDVRDQSSSDQADRTAWTNIDETPISIGPKITTKLLEQARNIYYEIGVNATDSMSVQTEEMEEARLWFEKENENYLRGQRAMLGIGAKEPEFMPININELELYKNSGGFKVPYAVNMELLLKHTFDISEWDKEVKEKILKDLVSIRYAMVRDYYDREEQRVKSKYVDPKFALLQFSRENSYKDSEYGGELEFWPISKVRQKFDMSHEEAAGLAYVHSNLYSNPTLSQWEDYGYVESASGKCGFDFYRVPIFRVEWIDIDNEKYYKKTTGNGKTFNKPLKNKDPQGLDVYDRRIRYVREATWIPGTEFLTDYGKAKYIARPNPRKPRISYRGIRLGTPALFQQIRPLLNGLTQAWWKTQEAIAIAISNGISVDVGALKNVSIGKDKSWNVLKILQYYRQQAILIHKRSNPMNFGQGGGMSPVQPLVLNMEKNILAQMEIMDRFMGMIESISGINLVTTGSTPEPRLGKYNMQVALDGTNQIIGSIIRASTELQSDVGTNIVARIRGYAKANKSIADSYAEVIGKQKMKVILDAEKNHVQYGINIEARDITEMKAFIDEILISSVKASAAGQQGMLDPSEVILVKDMLDQKQNMRMISLTLGYILRKKKKQATLEEFQKIEAQGNQLAKAEQEKEKNRAGERRFELVKLQKEFENDFMVKWGYTPSQAMKNASAQMPQGEQTVPAQQPPQPQQQEEMAPPVPQMQ